MLRRLSAWFAPLLAFSLGLLAWGLLVRWTGVKVYLLPGPLDVLAAAREHFADILDAGLLTGQAAVLGLSLSLILGTFISLLFGEFTWIRRGFLPYAIFLQTVPIIAVAPLIINWLGPGFWSVVLITLMVSLFPIISNTTTGLLSVPEELEDLFQLYEASRWQRLFRLRFPHAIPHLMTGARTSAGLAVIGAIVGEFFAGYSSQDKGLGFLIPMQIQRLKTAQAFAGVFTATLLGLVLYGAVTITRSLFLRRYCPEE